MTQLKTKPISIFSVYFKKYTAFLEASEHKICVYDEDGEPELTLPDTVPIELLRVFVQVHLDAFEKGLRCGKQSKIYEIKRILELD